MSAKLIHFVFAIFFILISTNQLIFPQSLKFKHLTVKDGLSNNKVNTVIQDQYGFMWFGTDDGLNRYDGYNFKIFRNNPEDSTSISDNSIWALTEDSKGNIWVGTKSGVLNKFDPSTEKFTKWELKSNASAENSIKSLYEDRAGNIWIGSYKDGLYKLNIKLNKIDHWVSDKTNPKSLSHNYVLSILEDTKGMIIVGTYIGLNIFDPENPQNGFKTYFFKDKNNKTVLSSNLIWQLTQSPIDSNLIWISAHNHLTKLNVKNYTFDRIEIPNPQNLQYGTATGYIIDEIENGQRILWSDSYSGLLKINLTTNKIIRFIHHDNNSQSIISNQINKVLRDKSGVIWLVTEHGISYSTKKSTQFNSVKLNNNFSILNNKNVTAISKNSYNTIFVGTEKGIFSIENFGSDLTINKILPLNDFHIWSLETKKNEIWAGTYGKGLKQLNTTTGKITNWNLYNSKTNTRALFYNKSLLQDKNGFIWIGYWGVGAARLNPKSGDYEIWLNDSENNNSLSHNDVWVIEEDRFGRIWLGTQGGGLNLFEDKNGGIFHHWLEMEDSSNSLNSNNIFCITESKSNIKDNETILWIGTNNGLNKIKITNKNDSSVYDFNTEFEYYSMKDGLQNNLVNSIVEAENGNLWLGTGSGISLFNTQNNSFTNFTSEDGINGTSMNPDAAIIFKNKYILMGSTKGLNIFDPDKISLSNYKPNLVFTDFQLFNKSVKIGKNSLLKKSLINTKKIELSPDQDVFSIEFAALDYNSPKSIEYAYKMEGFDSDWVESGNRRFVTYTNLDPGNYIFKVKSTNAYGVWTNNETLLNILVNPPWWRTIWANIAFVFLIVLGLYAIRRFELNRTKLRNELEMKEFEVKQKSELEEIKSRFFANLSHEFRTPLMLIKGPLEQLKNKKEPNTSESIDLIERNSNRLKELIDQLLELSQLEKAAIPLKAKEENLILLLKGLVSSFESLAEQKKINLKFESNSEKIICWIDKDKFEKIINNLLSNALKFTPGNGNINVIVSQNLITSKPIAEIIISDSGISIPKDKLDKIFDRFFQVDDSMQRNYGGSGIGLSLVKEFIDLHKWDISVKSEAGKGTEFKLEIPLGEEYLNKEEKIKNAAKYEITATKNNETVYTKTETSEHTEFIDPNKPSILIVDDSNDVRKYLKSLLEEKYFIIEAENGINGITTASEKIPDLIISDIMMPSMDGIEFCSKIKSEWQTSDIPVILLTAKASFESKLEGLQIGADDYLIKPFDSRELFTRIENLLEQRKRIKNKYNKNLDTIFRSDKLSAADNEFIKKALEVIDKNIDKQNFGTEQLAKELFMSRTKLHRKILKITAQPPGEFIRIHKLKRAAKLLIEDKFSVTQIAFEIGFSSPAQFTRAFSKQFDCVPSEFKLKNNPQK